MQVVEMLFFRTAALWPEKKEKEVFTVDVASCVVHFSSSLFMQIMLTEKNILQTFFFQHMAKEASLKT